MPPETPRKWKIESYTAELDGIHVAEFYQSIEVVKFSNDKHSKPLVLTESQAKWFKENMPSVKLSKTVVEYTVYQNIETL
jgi:hypothetical protein